MGTTSRSPHWDARYWCFGFARKAFLSSILLINNIHPWNKTNLDTHYNVYSFHYGHYNHVLDIGIHDINSLDLQEKLFFPPFSLLSKFIQEMRQTWIPIIIPILFVIGIIIMFSILGYMILMLEFLKKSFSFHLFP